MKLVIVTTYASLLEVVVNGLHGIGLDYSHIGAFLESGINSD